jgi:hypothetical protein
MRSAIFTAVVFFSAVPALAQTREWPAIPRTAEEQKIEQALESPISWNFDDVGLADVLQFIESEAGIDLELDAPALDGAGIDQNTTIDSSVREVPLRQGLQRFLKELNLAAVIENGAVLITTQDEADAKMRIVVFDVSDVVMDDSGEVDFYSLIDAITSTIEPDSWEDVGGQASIQELPKGAQSLLVIRQTDTALAEITGLLAALRQADSAFAGGLLGNAIGRRSTLLRSRAFVPAGRGAASVPPSQRHGGGNRPPQGSGGAGLF